MFQRHRAHLPKYLFARKRRERCHAKFATEEMVSPPLNPPQSFPRERKFLPPADWLGDSTSAPAAIDARSTVPAKLFQNAPAIPNLQEPPAVAAPIDLARPSSLRFARPESAPCVTGSASSGVGSSTVGWANSDVEPARSLGWRIPSTE